MLLIDNSLQLMGGLKKYIDTEFEINSITSGTQDKAITVGTGKGINFENPYITEEQVKEIYDRIVGFKYLPCEVKWFGNPASEAGDVVEIKDSNSKRYKALICNQSLNLTGGFNAQVKSIGNNDAEIQFSNTSPMQQKIKQTYTKLQEAIAEATTLINGAKGGIFRLTDSNGDGINDGWILADRQDKELPQDAKCLVANYEGLGLSQDGGRTYQNAITHKGVNADAINTGKINSIMYFAEGEKKFNKDDYSNSDIDRIKNIILGTITPTSKDYDRLDISGDGTIDMMDLVLCKRIISGEFNEFLTNRWNLTIAPNETNAIKVKQFFIKPDGKVVNFFDRFILNSGGAFFNNLTVKNNDNTEAVRICKDDQYVIRATGGDCWCGGTWVDGSLAKLKKNFKRIDSTLNLVKTGDIYSYNFKTEKDEDKKHFGFVIGEEFDTPEEVMSKGKDGIDTYSMCSILWKAVQELTKEVERLEEKVYGKRCNDVSTESF